MKSRGWAIFGVGGFAVVVLVATFLLRQPPIAYQNMTQPYHELKGLNYNCCSDRKDGIFEFGFMVSKDAVSWEDASTMCKVGPMNDKWKNKVWVTPIHADAEMPTMPADADVRIWGQVFVFGDRAFLSEIESGLRKKRVFTL